MNYENIISDVEACLDGYKWAYSHEQVIKMVDRWLEEKSGVIEVLRKHPQWNEDAMAVVFDYDSIRETDFFKYDSALNSLRSTYVSNGASYSEVESFDYITSRWKVCHQFVTDEIKEYFKAHGVNAAVGTKVSRVLGRYFRDIGLDKMDNYNRNYAILSDAINPLKITRFSLLSVHPCDYLNMSNGAGWDSCHSIQGSGGCHTAGTLSYMGDACSIIFYTVDKSYDGEARYFWREDKVNRQVYAYHKNMLLQSRLYPDYGDLDNCTNFRNAVQKIFADALGVPNYWTLTDGAQNIFDKGVRTSSESSHYKDYEFDQYRPSLSILKGAEPEEFYIGSQAYCIDCGEPLDENDTLNCCGRYKCASCGEYVDGYAHIGDEIYCRDCTIECDHCGRPHLQNETYESMINGHTRHACPSCVEQYYIHCDVCDELKYDHTDYIKAYGRGGNRHHVCHTCVTSIILNSMEKQCCGVVQ